MDEDNLVEADVRHALMHGSLELELTDDPRGVRFIVRGRKISKSKLSVASCPLECYV
jgi:hypothetical protein